MWRDLLKGVRFGQLIVAEHSVFGFDKTNKPTLVTDQRRLFSCSTAALTRTYANDRSAKFSLGLSGKVLSGRRLWRSLSQSQPKASPVSAQCRPQGHEVPDCNQTKVANASGFKLDLRYGSRSDRNSYSCADGHSCDFLALISTNLFHGSGTSSS